MIKSVKRNKRLKWIDSHYARPYQFQLFIRDCQVAVIAAQGKASLRAIKAAPGRLSTPKKLAIVKQMVSTTIAISKILEQPIKGRVTK